MTGAPPAFMQRAPSWAALTGRQAPAMVPAPPAEHQKAEESSLPTSPTSRDAGCFSSFRKQKKEGIVSPIAATRKAKAEVTPDSSLGATSSATNSALVSGQRNVTWTMGFAVGDRLRYAHLCSMMLSLTGKIEMRWHFQAWALYAQECVHRRSRNTRGRRNSWVSSASSSRLPSPGGGLSRSHSGVAAASIGRLTSAGGKIGRASSAASEMLQRVMHSGDDSASHQQILEHDGLTVKVNDSPLPYEFNVKTTPNYTGSDLRKMTGRIKVAFGTADNMWHIYYKEIGKFERDIGAIFMVQANKVERKAAAGHQVTAKKPSVVLGLIESDESRWKWTFDSLEHGDGASVHVETFREVLGLALEDNDAVLQFAQRLKRSMLNPDGIAKAFLTFDMAVLRVQRTWRKRKGKTKTMWSAKHEKSDETLMRARGAVLFQKLWRAFFARRKMALRRQDRQMECLSAVKLGDLDWVTLMVTRKGVNINFQDSRGRTPLHHAAEANQEAVISRLVKLGADIEAVDRRGDTSLHVACLKKASGAARRLAFLGADIEARNDDGWTPITRPHLFLMPLLEGLSRHILRAQGRLAMLYNEPSFLASRLGETRSTRYARSVDPLVGTPRARISLVASPREVAAATPRTMVDDSQDLQRSMAASLYADLHGRGLSLAVKTPLLRDPLAELLSSSLPSEASRFPELSHPALRKREKLLQMRRPRAPGADPLSTPRRDGFRQPMGWTVPMGKVTGRSAPGPVMSRR